MMLSCHYTLKIQIQYNRRTFATGDDIAMSKHVLLIKNENGFSFLIIEM